VGPLHGEALQQALGDGQPSVENDSKPAGARSEPAGARGAAAGYFRRAVGEAA
jgi:hypothetical protein